jgi:hypothetical protein
MRQFLISIPGALLLSGLVFSCPLYSQNLRRSFAPGHWQITENFENDKGKQTLEWAFELVDDGGSTLIAVGHHFETNGKPIRDRTIGILFIDRHNDGTSSGSLIEAYGDGEQSEMSLDIEPGRDGKNISMASYDGEGSLTSRFKGQWLGKGLESSLIPGTWEVREIVSPGKGSWDIQWKYQFKKTSETISGRGNKVIVNGRKAYRGEAGTYCQIDLKNHASHKNAVTGKGVETNYKGRKSRMEYEGWLSPSGRSFFLMSYESDGLAALIVGRYAG